MEVVFYIFAFICAVIFVRVPIEIVILLFKTAYLLFEILVIEVRYRSAKKADMNDEWEDR